MKKSFIMILVVLLVASSATAAFAAEEPSIHLFGNYTIRDDGLICYTIQMLGDPICYLGFTIDSDLEIIEVQTEDTAFSAAHYASNKVICYGMGDVIADYGMVITLILAAPEPDCFYSVNLFDVEAYNLQEKQLTVSIAMPVVEIEEPAPTEPAPTEPTPTEPAPTEPAPTEPTPTEPAPTKPAPTEPTPAESQPPSNGKSSVGDSGGMTHSQSGANETSDSTTDTTFLTLISNFAKEEPLGFTAICMAAILFLLTTIIPTSAKDDDKEGGEA